MNSYLILIIFTTGYLLEHRLIDLNIIDKHGKTPQEFAEFLGYSWFNEFVQELHVNHPPGIINYSSVMINHSSSFLNYSSGNINFI